MFSKIVKNFKFNRVVKYFIISDLILFSGWGLVSPIFAIFVADKIVGATLVTVGTSAAVYWISRSSMQIPIATYLDSKDSEKMTFYALLFGLLVASISAFSFMIIDSIWQLYLVQFAHGLGMAFYATSWNTIFSQHLDKHKVALEWAMDSASLGFASGVTGFLGGYAANAFGFSVVFGAAGTLSLIATIVIFFVPDLIIPFKAKEAGPTEDHTPKTVTS